MKQNEKILSGVSVIIGTLGDRQTLDRAVYSVLDQHIAEDKIEIVIVVNGANREVSDCICERFKEHPRVKVIYSSKPGPGLARNIGIANSTKEWLMILDDDDYLTCNALKVAEELITDDVNIIQMKVMTDEDGVISDNDYITDAIRNIKMRRTGNYSKCKTLFNNNATKLYRRSQWDVFDPIPENVMHTEDILFWAKNYGRLEGKVAMFPVNQYEGYIREVHSSLSRPDTIDEITDFVFDKLNLISEMTGVFFDPETSREHKSFITGLVAAQSQAIKSYMDDCKSQLVSDDVDDYLRCHPDTIIPVNLFAERKGICFSYYATPTVDVSAYVSSKRLAEINNIEGERIGWEILCKDMSAIRENDEDFDKFYAGRYYINKRFVFGREPAFIEINEFADHAIKKSLLHRADYIYSRSQPPHAHMAAYKYKKYYPEVKWYAEFSDPISVGPDGNRHSGEYGDICEEIEQIVYKYASKIIFTNENQMEHMIAYNPNQSINDDVRRKAIISHHPVMDSHYATFLPSEYDIDAEAINIGYFGSYYKGVRTHEDILKFLENETVNLHLFVSGYWSGGKISDIESDAAESGYDVARLYVNPATPYFEMLNIASHMDYLYLEDSEFGGLIHPYLPSKYADYKCACSAGTAKIIAKVQQGSVLSREAYPKLIKVESISDATKIIDSDDKINNVVVGAINAQE